jgi:CBS domain-containing protein
MTANSSPIPLAEEANALAARIDDAADIDALAGLAPEIRQLGMALLGLDAGAGFVTGILSTLNDRLATRVIVLIKPRHRLPAAGWCWLNMGSEGRGEQTFVTDQDNGLVFSAADHAEARALRPFLLAMAREVNAALDACGFPLCKGGIMAGNEKWCLSLQEWQQHFGGWILTPEPEALLNATIFFDLRPQFGDVTLAQYLRQYLQRLAPQANGFLHMMAANAVAVSPPLGRIRDLVGDQQKGGMIDLKTYGSRLFVDAARVLGLAAGSAAVGTVERLREAGAARGISPSDIKASILAFRHLQRIRLLDQYAKIQRGEQADNLLAPESLDPVDRQTLVECLKQARRLQYALQRSFSLEGL